VLFKNSLKGLKVDIQYRLSTVWSSEDIDQQNMV